MIEENPRGKDEDVVAVEENPKAREADGQRGTLDGERYERSSWKET